MTKTNKEARKGIFLKLPINNYDLLGERAGLVITGVDSCREGRGFESHHSRLDEHFSHLLLVKIVMFVWKDKNERKKRPGNAHL